MPCVMIAVRVVVGCIAPSGLPWLSARSIGGWLASALTVVVRFLPRLILILATFGGPDGIALHFQFLVPLDHNRRLWKLHALDLAIDSMPGVSYLLNTIL
jgi:hypothetical protein